MGKGGVKWEKLAKSGEKRSFWIELHCVSTDRVSDLAAIEWFS